MLIPGFVRVIWNIMVMILCKYLCNWNGDLQDQRRRGRGRRRSGRGEGADEVSAAPKKAQEPRETHKMLQV
jgi:hypothetical protein